MRARLLSLAALAATMLAMPAFADGTNTQRKADVPAPLGSGSKLTWTEDAAVERRVVVTRVVEAPVAAPCGCCCKPQVVYIQPGELNVAFTDGVGAGIDTGGYYGGGGGYYASGSGARYSGVLSARASAFTFQRRVKPPPPCGCKGRR